MFSWCLAAGLFSHVLSYHGAFLESVWHCDYLVGEQDYRFFSVYGVFTVCHGVFALPLGVIGKQCSVIFDSSCSFYCIFPAILKNLNAQCRVRYLGQIRCLLFISRFNFGSNYYNSLLLAIVWSLSMNSRTLKAVFQFSYLYNFINIIVPMKCFGIPPRR